MRVELRPSVPDDFAELADLLGGPHPFRARSLTALVDGKVIGIGGLVYRPNGEVWASVVMREEARRYPAAIHRAGLAAVRMMRAAGVRRVLASSENRPAAARWLLRLGFRQCGEVYVWQPDP
jgi:hypothetical protein